MVEQQQIGRDRSSGTGDLFQFSAADQRGGVWTVAALQEFAGHSGTGAGGQGAQFVERFLGRELRNGGSFRNHGAAGRFPRRRRLPAEPSSCALGVRLLPWAGPAIETDQKGPLFFFGGNRRRRGLARRARETR